MSSLEKYLLRSLAHLKIFLCLFTFERETEREHKWWGHRIWSRLQVLNCQHKLTNCEIMTWAEVECLTDWSTQAPWSFAHFKIVLLVYLLLSCIRSVYILDISPLSDIWFATIFSHLVGWLFILLMVSLAVKKVLSLIQSHLLIFAFVVFALGVWFQTSSLRLVSRSRDNCLCCLLGA